MKKLLVLCLLFISISLHAQAATGFTKVANQTTTSYVDTTCPNLSVCYYQVTSVDAQGFESQPAQCGATTLCLSGNIAIAVMPSSGTHTVTVSWIAPSPTPASYNVYRHLGPSPSASVSITIN